MEVKNCPLPAAGGKGTTLEKPKNESSLPNKLAAPSMIPGTEVVFVFCGKQLEVKKFKPGRQATAKFFVGTYMYLHELAALSSELQCCV